MKKLGGTYFCKNCNKSYVQEYRQQVSCSDSCQLIRNKQGFEKFRINNREKLSRHVAQYIRERKITDLDYATKCRQYSKEYRSKYREKINEASIVYYKKNREKINEARRGYYKKWKAEKKALKNDNRTD